MYNAISIHIAPAYLSPLLSRNANMCMRMCNHDEPYASFGFKRYFARLPREYVSPAYVYSATISVNVTAIR